MRPLWILLLAAVASGQTQPFVWTERTEPMRLGGVRASGSGFAVSDLDKDGDFDLVLADNDAARPAAVALENRGAEGFAVKRLDLPAGPATAVCAAPVEAYGAPRVFAAGPHGIRAAEGWIAGAFRQCLFAPGAADSPPQLLLLGSAGLGAADALTLQAAELSPLSDCDPRDVHWTPQGLFIACSAGADRHFVEGEDRGALLGSAYDALGARQRTLFITSGDVDGDGRLDLVKLADQELPLLYRQAKDGFFDAEPAALAMGAHAALLADFDLDGDLDLALSDSTGIALFRNTDGRGRYLAAGRIDGPARAELAFVDLDGDRLAEIVARSRDGSLRVFGIAAAGNFLTVRLEAAGASALGAEVSIEAAGAGQVRMVNERAEVYFGLGEARSASRMRVVWPSGRSQLALGLRAGQAYLVREGAPPEGL